MIVLQTKKDGDPSSTADALYIIEVKWLFSIVLLKFNKGCL